MSSVLFRITGRMSARRLNPRPEYPLPRAGQMVRNGAAATLRNVRQATAGHPLRADPAEIERRRQICVDCGWFRPSDERCAHEGCGCILKFKTWLMAERCPDGKW